MANVDLWRRREGYAKVNVEGVQNIVSASRDTYYLTHISTDYIFDGKNLYI